MGFTASNSVAALAGEATNPADMLDNLRPQTVLAEELGFEAMWRGTVVGTFCGRCKPQSVVVPLEGLPQMDQRRLDSRDIRRGLSQGITS